MNSILNRILLINSFNNPRLRSILAASSSNWDTSKNPKAGTAVFPNQDNETLLKLMQLMPYITYDNVVAALQAKSRLNNEPSKNELCDKFIKVYRNLYVVKKNDEDIETDDDYSVDDINALEFAIEHLQRIMDKSHNEELQKLKEQLQAANSRVSDLIKEQKRINKESDDIEKTIAKLTNQQTTDVNYNMNNIHAEDDFLQAISQIANDGENIEEEENIKEEENDEDIEYKIREDYKKLQNEKNELRKQLSKLNSERIQLQKSNNQSEATINRMRQLNNDINQLNDDIDQLNIKIAPLKRLIELYDRQDKLYDEKMELGDKIYEAKQLAKKSKKSLEQYKHQLSPYSKKYQYTMDMDEETRKASTLYRNLHSAITARDKNEEVKTNSDNRLEVLRSKGKLTQEERDEIQTLTNTLNNAKEQASKLAQEVSKAQQKLYQKQMQDTRTLMQDLLQTGLYEKNCPYAYACELMQNECGKTNNLSDDIKINQSKSYQYMKYTNFQNALNKIANAMPSIYKEIIDDIYAKYDKYPSFHKDFDMTDREYNNLKMVTYTPVEEGTGNYVYDVESKTYKFDAENGNFKRTFTPLNTHAQISMSVPVGNDIFDKMDRYSYDESTTNYILDPKGEYIKVPKTLRYIYKDGKYIPQFNGNFIKLPTGKFQEISNGDFHKLPQQNWYKKQTVLENNNNFQRQIDTTGMNYIFRQVEPGQGNFIYNTKAKRYEYSPQNGDFIRVPAFDSQSKKDMYVADGRLLSLARQLVRFEYRNRTGYIDPILVTYYRGKYDNAEDSEYNVNYFFYELKKYIKWLKFIDEADPEKDIIDDNYEKHVEELKRAKNAGKLKLQDIKNYIEEKLDIGNKHDTIKLTSKELSSRNKTDKERLDNNAIKSSATNLKILHKYNYDVYKNYNHIIDPIMIAWAEFYHIYNAQRRNWKKQIKTMQSTFLDTKKKINTIIQKFKDNIKQDIDNIPDGSTIPENEKKQLIKQMLNIDLANIEPQTMDRDYRLARIKQLREQYRTKAQDLLEQINTIGNNMRNANGTDFNYKTLLYRLQEAFCHQVNFFGDMLNEVRDNDKSGIAKRLIEVPSNWQNKLEEMLRKLDGYIKNERFKNFNPAYYVDLLENFINKYGGGKKDYNPINEDNYREIPELSTRWTEHTIEYELNKIFESYDRN